MSPSIWWDDCAVYRLVDGIKRKPPLKIWLDTGTEEEGWERARELRDRLIAKGWMLGRDLQYHEAGGRPAHGSGLGGAAGLGVHVSVPRRRGL